MGVEGTGRANLPQRFEAAFLLKVVAVRLGFAFLPLRLRIPGIVSLRAMLYSMLYSLPDAP
jgi:hypothetical protein